MDTESDLITADRDVLIAQLQATVLEQQRVIERWSGGLPNWKARRSRTARPECPASSPVRAASRQRSSSPGSSDATASPRPRMTPTHRVEHVVENCPDCGTHLTGGWVQRTREVIEVPVVPVQVTEHVFIARTCPVCRRRRVPTAQLDGAVLGRQRLGVNLISRIATLREEGPCRSAASSGICTPSIS